MMTYDKLTRRRYMLYYDYQFKRYQTQEVLMTSNVVDGIIASMLFALLSTGVGLIFQALGFSSQEALFAGVSTLLFLLMLFLIFIGLEKHFDKLWECSVPPQ